MTDDYEPFETANEVENKTEEPPKEEAKAEDKTKAKADDKQKDSGNEDDDASKRWQSKADQEAARANKAEAELDRMRRAQTVEQKDGEAKPTSGSEDPWVQASKGNFRDDLFNSDPRLAALGFSPDLIQGSTPAEMRQTFVSLQGTVDRMETNVRNQVLVEHGLQPVPGSGQRATSVNFRTMPQEEFLKEVDKALQG